MRVWQKLENYQETNYLRWNIFTSIGISLIIICGIKMSCNLSRYMDLLFWDESLYMTRGTMMFQSVPRDWGPSYSLWYKLLSFFISDKVELYYFNFKLTTILFSICLFLLMLSCGVQRILAFMLALFSLSTFINMPVWPHVSHFCVIVLIIGIIVAKYQRTLISKFAIYSFTLMISAYARPELFLAFFPVFICTYLLLIINVKRAAKKDIVLAALLLFLFLFVYKFFRTPFNNGDARRGIGVFLQHFALNYYKWQPSASPFWLDFFDIIQKEFKGATTFRGLIAANPELLQRHITSNITFYFTQTAKIIIDFFVPLFTKHIRWLSILASLALLFTYFFFAESSKNKRPRLFSLLKDNLLTIAILILFTSPSIIVCIYAYPRDHYLILQVPILLVVISSVISSITIEPTKPILKIIAIAMVWFFAMPIAKDFNYFNLYRKTNSLANLQTVNYVKKNLATADTVRMFDVEGGMINFLPANYTNDYYLWRRDKEQLSDFLLAKDFDIIYRTPTLTALNCVQKDTVLFDLLAHPEKYGYYKQKTGNFEPYLLIKKKK